MFRVYTPMEPVHFPISVDVGNLFPIFGQHHQALYVYKVGQYHMPSSKKYRPFFSDGRLNYPLLYMASIALSKHRDIQFV